MVICKILSLGFPISDGNIPFQIRMKGKQHPCTSADTSEGSEVLPSVRNSRVFFCPDSIPISLCIHWSLLLYGQYRVYRMKFCLLLNKYIRAGKQSAPQISDRSSKTFFILFIC